MKAAAKAIRATICLLILFGLPSAFQRLFLSLSVPSTENQAETMYNVIVEKTKVFTGDANMISCKN